MAEPEHPPKTVATTARIDDSFGTSRNAAPAGARAGFDVEAGGFGPAVALHDEQSDDHVCVEVELPLRAPEAIGRTGRQGHTTPCDGAESDRFRASVGAEQ